MQNPIAQAELAFQQRAERTPRWRRWLAQGITLVAVTLALILYGGEIAGSLLQRDPTPIAERLGVSVVLLLVYTTALHFMLMFRALAVSANSITREAQGSTWELLVLTGLDARQIVLGKWWATVRRLWRAYAVLALLRACLAVWITTSTARLTAYLAVSTSSFATLQPPYQLSSVGQLLAAGMLVMALTMANLLFTAACGVLASSEARSSAWALARALGSRVVLLIAASSVLVILSIVLWNSPLSTMTEMTTRVSSALLDNGLSLAGELLVYQSWYAMQDTSGSALLAGILSGGAYGLLAWSLLMAAQRRLIRRAALPPEAQGTTKR